MTLKEWKALEEISYKFYDTIDIKQFFPKGMRRFKVREVMDAIEDEYDCTHSDLIPPELYGHAFDVIGEEEFAEYLKKRYNVELDWRIIEYYDVILKDGENE